MWEWVSHSAASAPLRSNKLKLRSCARCPPMPQNVVDAQKLKISTLILHLSCFVSLAGLGRH